MLSPGIVQEVRRLLAEGKLSQRKISRAVGVSRSTVGLIASGRRPDYDQRRNTEDLDPLRPPGPPVRCRSCGGMVYAPCRLCRVRAAQAIQRDRLRFRRYWQQIADNARRAG